MEGIKPNVWNDGSIKVLRDYHALKDFILVAFTKDDTVPKEEIKFNIGKNAPNGKIVITPRICNNRENNIWMLDGLSPMVNISNCTTRQLGIKIVKWMWADPGIEGDV